MNHSSIVLRNLGNSALGGLARAAKRPLVKPVEIRLSITSRCNARCLMCAEWRTAAKQDIDTGLAKKVITDLHAWLKTYYLNILGGEPLLHPDFLEIAGFAAKHGAYAGIITNGLLLTKDMADAIIRGKLFNVNLSIDGLQAATHDHVRGREGCHKKVTDGLHHLIEAKLRHRADTRIVVKPIIMGANITEIVPLVREFEHVKGFNGFRFQPLRRENIPDTAEDLMVKDADEAIGVIDELIRIKRAGAPILNGYAHLNQIRQSYRSKDEAKRAAQVRTCPVGYDGIHISAAGDMYLCYPLPSVGNLKTMSAPEAFNSAKALKVRKTIATCQRNCMSVCYTKKSLRDKAGLFYQLFLKK